MVQMYLNGTSVQGPSDVNNNGATVYPIYANQLASVGSYQVVIEYLGNGSYAPTQETFSLNVLSKTPTITWSPPASLPCGTALAPTQLDATASVSGTFTYSPAVGTVLPCTGQQQLSVSFAPQNTGFNAATASVPISVLPVPVVTVTVPSQSIVLGSGATVGVHVNCASTCGSVQFTVDDNQVGSPIALSNTGDVSLPIPASALPTARTYQIAVQYLGNTSYAPSQGSSPITVVPPGPAAGTVLYSYSITKPDGASSGYDPAGNIVAYDDSINQRWTASYDALNRLTSASQVVLPTAPANTTIPASWGNAVQQYFCWQYDAYGNRTTQISAASPFTNRGSCGLPPNVPNTPTNISYDEVNGNNRIANSGYTYDNSGNITGDGTFTYQYDGAGRLCAVLRNVTGEMTGYLYDAEGRRVAKGSINPQTGNWCDFDTNGFTTAEHDILGLGGEKLVELNGDDTWRRTYVYGGGQLVATYDGTSTHFHFSDWLGTRRLQTDIYGNTEETCSGGAFGEVNCTGSENATLHFTGKERDTETGTPGRIDGWDYFGARYYGSSLGRFASPDPSGLAFAGLTNPQMFNLYSYTINNPLGFIDPSGLALQQICDRGHETSASTVDENGNEVVTVNAGVHCSLEDDGKDPKPKFMLSQHALTQFPLVSRNYVPGCPPVPTHLPSMNLQENIDAAGHKNALDMYNDVRNGGPQDYKQDKTLNDVPDSRGRPFALESMYEDFGNFNYGAVGEAQMFSLNFLQRMGGYAGQRAQGAGFFLAVKTAFFSNDPAHGDDPKDQAQIAAGYNYAMRGCHE